MTLAPTPKPTVASTAAVNEAQAADIATLEARVAHLEDIAKALMMRMYEVETACGVRRG